ncbi:MAG: cysteine-rich CWC family protein [Blastocatellia bacterium]|nr:cysteine-rich CWC family protein [Blastocatellia bacterium]
MKLKTLAAFFNPDLREPIICEACGNPFQCGASIKGCWCMHVTVSAEVRAELKKHFTHCLCPHCLERFAQGEPISSPLLQKEPQGKI